MEDFRIRYNYFINHTDKTHTQHQEDGMVWCVQHESKKQDFQSIHGGIIADEMGCGKTVMMISLMVCNFVPRTLIVVPLALISQWKQNILETTGHIPLLYYGNQTVSSDAKIITNACPIVLTTYGVISHKFKKFYNTDILFKTKWDRIIFDEAHHMRNHKTQKYNAGIQLKSRVKWLITGTPIQNKIDDLYHLCEIIGIKNAKTIPLDLIKENILKRTKRDVGIVLPDLHIHNLSVEWKNDDEKKIADVLHRITQNNSDKEDTKTCSVQSDDKTYSFTANEEICDSTKYHHDVTHNSSESKSSSDRKSLEFIPFMDKNDESKNLHSFINTIFGGHRLSYYLRCKQMCTLPRLLSDLQKRTYDDPNTIDNGLLHMNKIDELVKHMVSRNSNHKKIIFCSFRKEMDIVKENLENNGIEDVHIYDGRISQKKRINTLEKQPNVLILQVKMGSEGLNLQYANEIYFVGPLWNPAMEDQAIGRCYRLGQNNPTHVFKFNMNNIIMDDESCSMDNYMIDVLERKRILMKSL
jgi:SNF2 family DNA or RNA helicase